ncbi:hypothetical protein C2E23DRAFT_292502 [Lenzites betulinus]|nr:hypothetical protein C2E23DRAFT_292502 [Lenzites betulinus]
MSSFRAALALAVLAPAILCGASQVAYDPAATSLSAFIENDANATNADSSLHALSTRANSRARFSACLDSGCQQGCIDFPLVDIQLNFCQFINLGEVFNSAQLVLDSTEDLPFDVLVSQSSTPGPPDSEAAICDVSAVVPLQTCLSLQDTPVNAFVLVQPQ